MSAVIELTTARARLDVAELADLRSALLSERSKHLGVAQLSRRSAAEFGGQDSPHSIVERQTATAAGVRARHMIAEIDAALARIDSGTYGLCDLCGRAIPLARLLALPHTRRCVECAERRVGTTPHGGASILEG